MAAAPMRKRQLGSSIARSVPT
uniref:Uncharacterized protein n=1 Tax=Arundo donax TaxID=35708 RepID=A0A0A8YST6_ARUDO